MPNPRRLAAIQMLVALGLTRPEKTGKMTFIVGHLTGIADRAT
ncbi:MAG TPA: hypothetical protein VM492_08780 [Sumerlaeia bacterium]|nr:hypothetical protein [Sumerlaeia bacterium]